DLPAAVPRLLGRVEVATAHQPEVEAPGEAVGGVRHHEVDGPDLALGRRDERLEGCRVAHVALHGRLPERAGDRLGQLVVEVGEDDALGALRDESLGEAAPDAVAGTGDDDDLAFDLHDRTSGRWCGARGLIVYSSSTPSGMW